MFTEDSPSIEVVIRTKISQKQRQQETSSLIIHTAECNDRQACQDTECRPLLDPLCQEEEQTTIRALILTYTVLGVPYCKYSMIYPKTLFQLVRPLYYHLVLVVSYRRKLGVVARVLQTTQYSRN